MISLSSDRKTVPHEEKYAVKDRYCRLCCHSRIAQIYNYYLTSPTTHYAGVDKFAIKEIYPTKTGGEEWFMNMNDPGNDRRIGGEGPPTTFVQQNHYGSWKVQSNEVRYGVLTSSGYHPDLITTLNQQALVCKGIHAITE